MVPVNICNLVFLVITIGQSVEGGLVLFFGRNSELLLMKPKPLLCKKTPDLAKTISLPNP